jgi:hypothetical protein
LICPAVFETQQIGAALIFVIINTFWERQYAALHEREKELKQETEELQKIMEQLSDHFSGWIRTVLAQHGLERSDLNAPEVQGMTIREAVQYLKERKQVPPG